jgi:hypothetical protein
MPAAQMAVMLAALHRPGVELVEQLANPGVQGRDCVRPRAFSAFWS